MTRRNQYRKHFAGLQELFANSLQKAYIRGMDTKKLIEHYGSQKVAMAKIGTYRQQWDYWAENGIPRMWQILIQNLTDGKLKAKAKKK